MKPTLVNKLTGALFIVGAVAIFFFYPCPSRVGQFLIYVLTGIGIALILLRRGDTGRMSVKFANTTILLSGGVALPFILFLVNPIDRFKQDNCQLKFGVTVFVHGKEGRQDLILRQKGYVIMDLGNERKKAPIDENGAAHFENLQAGDLARINIDFSEPYHSTTPDSVYTLHPQTSVYLQVALSGTDRVNGKVLDSDGPLAGVLVEIDTLKGHTGQDGNFFIQIPERLQKDRYEVWFQKDGFKSKKATAYPETGQPLEVVLEKSTK